MAYSNIRLYALTVLLPLLGIQNLLSSGANELSIKTPEILELSVHGEGRITGYIIWGHESALPQTDGTQSNKFEIKAGVKTKVENFSFEWFVVPKNVTHFQFLPLDKQLNNSQWIDLRKKEKSDFHYYVSIEIAPKNQTFEAIGKSYIEKERNPPRGRILPVTKPSENEQWIYLGSRYRSHSRYTSKATLPWRTMYWLEDGTRHLPLQERRNKRVWQQPHELRGKFIIADFPMVARRGPAHDSIAMPHQIRPGTRCEIVSINTQYDRKSYYIRAKVKIASPTSDTSSNTTP